MIETVYDLLQLVWKTYHFSPKSKRELKAIGMELGCAIRTPSAVKTQRWLPHIYRALSLFFLHLITVQARVNIQLCTSTCNTSLLHPKTLKLEEEQNTYHILPFVAFCNFLHDLFGEILKLSLVLQKNSFILSQAVAVIDSCVCTIKAMKDKPVRGGKLEEFLSHTNFCFSA